MAYYNGTNNRDTIWGSDYSDSIYGNGGDDYIDGKRGTDTIYGGDGNDTIFAGDDANYDYLFGGRGNDTFYINDAADTVYENANEGIDTIILGKTFYNMAQSAGVENLTITDSGPWTTSWAYGNSLNNVITGGSKNNYLTGEDGNDTLDGKVGQDSLFGGNGNDTLIGFGNDLNNTVTQDFLNGGAGNDTFIVDTMDIVSELQGGGIDTISYRDGGVDYYMAANVENLNSDSRFDTRIHGNAENNTIHGNVAKNFLNGNEGNDLLYGWEGNDTLLGGLGNDTLFGGSGDDLLVFDGGYDRMRGDNPWESGASGKDTFFLRDMPGSGNLVIEDFQPGVDTLAADPNLDIYMLRANGPDSCYLIVADKYDGTNVQDTHYTVDLTGVSYNTMSNYLSTTGWDFAAPPTFG